MLAGAISFWRNQRGQDFVEYSLILAFLVLTGAAFFLSVGLYTSGLWGIVNSRLAASNQS